MAAAIMLEPPRDRVLWKLIAYAGRYGSTPPNVARHMTIGDLVRFVEAIAKILEEEHEAAEEAAKGT